MNRELIDNIYLIYLEGVDIQSKIMELKKEGYSLDDIHDAMKVLYVNGTIHVVKGDVFENCFSRGGRGNHVKIVYADHLEMA